MSENNNKYADGDFLLPDADDRNSLWQFSLASFHRCRTNEILDWILWPRRSSSLIRSFFSFLYKQRRKKETIDKFKIFSFAQVNQKIPRFSLRRRRRRWSTLSISSLDSCSNLLTTNCNNFEDFLFELWATDRKRFAEKTFVGDESIDRGGSFTLWNDLPVRGVFVEEGSETNWTFIRFRSSAGIDGTSSLFSGFALDNHWPPLVITGCRRTYWLGFSSSFSALSPFFMLNMSSKSISSVFVARRTFFVEKISSISGFERFFCVCVWDGRGTISTRCRFGFDWKIFSNSSSSTFTLLLVDLLVAVAEVFLAKNSSSFVWPLIAHRFGRTDWWWNAEGVKSGPMTCGDISA